MFNRVMVLALTTVLVLALAGCGGGGEQPQQASHPAAAPAPPPKPVEETVELYELTKDDITSHKDWTSRNVTILGGKIGDKTRDVEKNLGKLDNTRTTPE